MSNNWGWQEWNPEWILDTKKYDKLENERAKYKYACPKCGRKMIIAYKNDKTICDWCGTLIYKDEKAKFKDQMQKRLRKKEGE